MIKQTIGAVAVAAALLAAPAAAQDHAMRHGAHGPAMHRQELGLTADQAARLDAIHAQVRAAHQEHCRHLAAADAQQKEAVHERMRDAVQRAHQEAQAVLTAEQRARLDSIHAAHHGGAQGHRHGAAHGEHAGQHAQHMAQHAEHAARHAQHHPQGAQAAAGEGGHECADDCCGGADCCQDGTCREVCEECCKTCCAREERAAGAQHRHQGQHGRHGAHGGGHSP